MVTVTDSLGQTVQDTLMVTEPQPLITTVVTSDDTCGFCVGTANAQVSGGTAPYIYNWSTCNIVTWVTNLCAGNYSLTVTDFNGCLAVSTGIVANTGNASCAWGTVSGTVYEDLNLNCNQDTLENGIANILLQALPGPYYASTDVNGNYSMSLPYGSYTITQVPTTYIVEVCPVGGSYSVTLDSLNINSINNNFGDTLISVQDVRVSVSSGNIVPGFIVPYYLNYTSFDNNPTSGTVSLVVDDTLTYQYASVPPDLISGDTLFWNYTNLQYFENRYITTYFLVPAEVGLLGDTMQACASITPLVGDVVPSNNTDCYDRVVIGSYDPNDKQVSPEGIGPTGGILLSETELTYTIRFQNTGTFHATNVVVVDTLSANVDLTSLRDVVASHPFTYDVSGQGILTFTFNNIMLPDSNTDEPESHGLIQFKIDQAPSNGIGTVIENTAEIYFDFNPAIVTNTVINTIVTITDINENEEFDNKVNVYPNPSEGNFSISFELKRSEEVSISIVDILGKEVESISRKSLEKGIHKREMNLNSMNSGIYFMSIKIGNENHLKKVVIQ